MNYKCKPIYLVFPILQISYILFWIPVGYRISCILSALGVTIVYNILSAVLGAIYSFAYDMFALSGGMEALVEPYYLIVAIFLDLIILITGLELISCFLNKKRKEGGFDEHSSDGQN